MIEILVDTGRPTVREAWLDLRLEHLPSSAVTYVDPTCVNPFAEYEPTTAHAEQRHRDRYRAAIGATLVMQCGVAAFARAELELAPTDWSMTVTMLGFELDRASGDIDSVLGLSAVGVPVWVAWPLGGVRDGDGGTAFELDTREARHEFGQGLSRAGTQRIVDAALEYLCYGQLAI